MSDQRIHISAHTDEEGIVHIDIPTGIANQDIQLIVSPIYSKLLTADSKFSFYDVNVIW